MMLDDAKGNNLENRCGRQSTGSPLARGEWGGSNPILSATQVIVTSLFIYHHCRAIEV